MKKIFFIITWLIIITNLSIHSFPDNALSQTEEELILYLGQVRIVSVNHPRRIIIANPNVADVTNATRSEITLNPKAVGTTTLVVWDNFGEQSYQVKVFAESMQEIKYRIDNLLKKLNMLEVYTQVEDEEGKVLLLGSVKTAQDRERIISALGTLKDKTVDLLVIRELESVVEIDVQVLEIDRDATSTLGFTWPGSISLTDSSGPITTAVTGLERIFHVSDFTRSAFNVTLDALVQEGKARILSRPRLACQSGKEAELLVGGEKPIFTTTVAATTGAAGTEVEYKEYGIKLKIRPTVTEEERIKLGLKVEVSEVGAADTIGPANAPTAKAFPLIKRTTSTELYLNNGQTMAISGLIRQKTEEDIRKTPWLGDLPVLGLFFRKKTTKIGGGQGERGNTELVITLTPTIVSHDEAVKIQKEIKPKTTVFVPLEENISDPVQGYSRIIQKRILDNLKYPLLAKEADFQGTVKLSLHLSYQGELLDAAIKSSSGYKILDEDALSVAHQIGRYPPFPTSIEQNELWIDIPIVYHLD